MAKTTRTTLTTHEAATLAEVDRRTWTRIAEEAGLTVRTLPGQAPRYLRAEVLAFLDAHTVKGQRSQAVAQ